MDLCLKHNTDFITNLVGSRTQISVSYASAFLVPGWQLLTCLYAGPVAWIMLFIVRQLTILHGGLDIFSFWLPLCGGCTCQAVRGFPTFAPCLENICAGGGGVV